MSNYTNIAKESNITRWFYVTQPHHRKRCCECEKLIELNDLAIYCYPNTKLVYVHYKCIDKFIEHKIEELHEWRKEIEIKKTEFIPSKPLAIEGEILLT